MKLRVSTAVLASLALAAMAGCTGGLTPPPVGDVQTFVEPAEVRAGQAAAVRCEVRNRHGALADQPTEWTVDPAAGVTVESGTATPTIVGTYAFTCRATRLDQADPTPATLTVRPGDPASTVATVDPASVQAGKDAAASCAVYDAYGNVITDAKTSIDPVDGLTVHGMAVSATKVGAYDIACSVEGFQVAQTKAQLTVAPGDPVRLVMSAQPDRKVYAIDATVQVSWKVYDAYDNVIDGLPATLTPPPNPGMKGIGANKFRFEAEGHYLVQVALDAPWQSVGDQRTFVCDVGGPTFDELFPPRGHTQDTDPAINVHGKVGDAAGSKVTEVTVNGEAATLNADGTFEYPTSGVHGLNVLVITAKDEYGNETRVTRGWYFSTGWLQVDDATTLDDAILPESVLLNLRQEFLDDGDHDPSHPNDLATLLELVLSGVVQPLLADLPAFPFNLPNVINAKVLGIGLEGDLEILVQVKDVTLGQPRVSMDLMDGGISAGIQFQPVSLGLELTFIVHARAAAFGQSIPLLDPATTSTGSLSVGTLGVSVSMMIAQPLHGDLSVEGRDFQLTLTDVNISPVESLKIDLGKIPGTSIDLGEVDLDWLVGPINGLISQYVLNPLVNLITQPLIDLLEPLVVPLIGDLVQQLLDLLNLRQSFALPDLMGTGNPVDLGLALGISTIAFTEEAGRIGLDLGFQTAKGVTRQPPLGSILRDSCDRTEQDPVQFVFPAQPSVQVGLTHDVLNELLFMVWWGGVIQGDFDASALLGGGGALPVDNLVITPTLWLPPIFNDCGGDQRLQIGDLFLEIQMDLLGNTQWLEAWLQVDAEVGIIATGNEVGLKIGKIRHLEYEIYDVGGGLGDLLDMVTGLLPGLLKNVEGQQFTFPIPEIPLDGLLPGIPAGTSLKLGNLTAGVDTGVIRFGGDLQ